MSVLEEHECWALVRTVEVGRLAVAIMNRPDIFPVNHIVDGGRIVFRTAEGTKLAAAVLGQAVAYEVDGYDPARGEAWSVVIKGRAVEIERMSEMFDACELPLFPWHASPKPRFVRIEPETITGRRFRVVERPADSSASRRRSSPE
jgi:nitroimidazol reductase NimA-like FMN-containing flavoprotein (pyridoxamine 5'-phosphate oxidase superfamily)